MTTLEDVDRRLTLLENLHAYKSYSQREVAELSGLSESTIARYRRAGIITQIEGTHKYSFETITKLLQL